MNKTEECKNGGGGRGVINGKETYIRKLSSIGGDSQLLSLLLVGKRIPILTADFMGTPPPRLNLFATAQIGGNLSNATDTRSNRLECMIFRN